jgi:myo-inositol-1(or 4)-monophosphatase
MTTSNPRLDVAIAVMAEAGALALELFEQRQRFALEEKTASEYVSEADRQVERLIRDRLAARLPGDALMGEEMGGDGAPAFWSIDPIDGTANFLRGSPLWGVSLGFVVDGRSAVGVICYPALGMTLAAAAGLGVWRDGRPFRREVHFPAVRVAAVGESPRWPAEGIAAVELALRRAGWGVAEYRCASIGLGFAALGYVDGYIEKYLSIWDLAAGAVICAEAGLVTRYAGSHRAAGMWICAAIPAVQALMAPCFVEELEGLP